MNKLAIRVIPVLALLVALTVFLSVAIKFYNSSSSGSNGRSIMHIEPEVLSLAEAAKRASLVFVGTVHKENEVIMENTGDGWDRAVSPSPNVRGTPHTNFRVEVNKLIKAPEGFDQQEIVLRVLGGSSVIMEPDIDHLSQMQDGGQYLLFVRESYSPHDPDTWRPIDSVHILPITNGLVHPNSRIMKWNVDSVKSPTKIDEVRQLIQQKAQ